MPKVFKEMTASEVTITYEEMEAEARFYDVLEPETWE